MQNVYLLLGIPLAVIAAGSVLLRKKGEYMPAVIFACALAVPLLAGMGLRVREAVEGPFAYLDNVLAILCAALFCALLADNGTFEALLARWLRRPCAPWLRLAGLLLIIAIPGMLSGSALVAAATCGALAGRLLMRRGLPKAKAVEIAAAGSFIGMILPPLCVPGILLVMGRAATYPPSFEGFFVPLLALGLPALIIYALARGRWLLADIQAEEAEKLPAAGAGAYLPLAVVFVLVVSHNFLYRWLPYLGYPLIYVLGIALAALLGPRRVQTLNSLARGLGLAALPCALLFATAALNEAFWLTGVNGTLNTWLLQASPVWLFMIPALLLLAGGRLLGLPLAWALCAVIPNIANGAGYQLSPLRLLALGAVLGAAAFRTYMGGSIYTQTARLIVPEDPDKVSVPMPACIPVAVVMVLAVAMGLLGNGIDWLMV